MAGRASVRFANRSSGFGRNTSSRSPTTSIVGSLLPACGRKRSGYMAGERGRGCILTWRLKKCRAESTPMMHSRVRLSWLGSRSSVSSRVRAAVASMPEETAA